MWEGSVHEALLPQGAAGHGDHGHLPWLGPAAMPHMPSAFAAEPAAFGGYCEGGAGTYGGVLGVEPPHAVSGGGGARGRMVSELFGSLQAEFGRMTAKEIMDAKALAASRSHSEAERRRRQRINGHLARLRSLLPSTTKTDKASLLAEVIEHVKELKRQTSAMMVAAAGVEDGGPVQQMQLLPTEADELAVDAVADDEGRFVVRASLCCEDRLDLIPDIVRALAALRLRARRAEITTLGGRVRNVLLITADEGYNDEDDDNVNGGDDDDDERAATHRRHELIASIQEALRGVMNCKAASSDTSSSSGGGGGSIKRQRMTGAHEQGSV